MTLIFNFIHLRIYSMFDFMHVRSDITDIVRSKIIILILILLPRFWFIKGVEND